MTFQIKRNARKGQDDNLNEAEMQPLRGTLIQLARKASAINDDSVAPSGEIRG